ncbi:MAG: hypothetical protein HZB46_18480 [Solirubrobacterales bacterium]|nr:hypothetical protein [Solirubrobacterales bacterium]
MLVMVDMSTLVLRPATPEDATALRRLAALDSQRPIAGPSLVAEVDGGRLVAAIAQASGRVVADPFLPTAEAAELLRHRLEQRVARVGAAPGLLRFDVRTA